MFDFTFLDAVLMLFLGSSFTVKLALCDWAKKDLFANGSGKLLITVFLCQWVGIK